MSVYVWADRYLGAEMEFGEYIESLVWDSIIYPIFQGLLSVFETVIFGLLDMAYGILDTISSTITGILG